MAHVPEVNRSRWTPLAAMTPDEIVQLLRLQKRELAEAIRLIGEADERAPEELHEAITLACRAYAELRDTADELALRYRVLLNYAEDYSPDPDGETKA